MTPAMNASQDPLTNLRDIHLPETIGFWPPAPIWWLIFLAVLAGVVCLVVYLTKKHKKNLYRRQAVSELDTLAQNHQRNGDTAQLLSQINALLKRTAMSHQGRQSGIEQLTGTAWLDFLQRQHSTQRHLFNGIEWVFTDAIYRSSPQISDAQLLQLLNDTKLWLQGRGVSAVRVDIDKTDTLKADSIKTSDIKARHINAKGAEHA